MYNISTHRNVYDQGDCDVSSVGSSCQSSLSLVVSDPVDPSVSNIASTDNPLSHNELLQDMYDFCGYVSNFEKLSEDYDDSFLHSYSIKHGYKFSEFFWSMLDKLKINFIDKVDSILIDLCGSFCFFQENLEGCFDANIVFLMNKSCLTFSKRAYNLISKCIDILRHEIVPIAIKIITEATVIDGESESKVTYPEMEKLFLYFITRLERLVMAKVKNHWSKFYNKKKDALLSISDIDYSNPFICVHNLYKISHPITNCPAAFTNKFGERISFIAGAKLDDMILSFIDNCNDVLKEVIHYKCSYIYGYSSNTCADFVKLYDSLRINFYNLIEKEFNKNILEVRIKDRIVDFFNNLVIWGKVKITESDVVLIFDNIIRYMKNLLVDKSTNSACRIIRNFNESKSLAIKRLLKDWKCKWGVKIHPGDINKISSIRKKFAAECKNNVRDKFCEMLKEKHKFLDGTVIGIFNWDKASKNMFPIAQETVRNIIDVEREELSNFLLNVRIIDDDSIFDGSSYSVRKATSEEREEIFKISSNFIYDSNRNLFRLVWRDLIRSSADNISKDICDDSLDTINSAQNDLPVVTLMSADLLGKRDKIINIWGLNIHPDDNKVILFVVRKFSNKIRFHLAELFSGMLRRRAVLPSGIVLCDSSWTIISSELSEIAIESVRSIIENQLAELDIVLSKLRVLDANGGDSSCIIRKITNDEKKELMLRASRIVDRRLTSAIRLSWLRVVNKSSTDIGYGYKEKYQDVDKLFVGGSWGVKLRYSDNVAILNARISFSSKIKDVVYAKFSSMIRNKHKFNDGTFIGAFAWFRVSPKLSPIVKEEVRAIIEDEQEEIEKIISKARVVVDSKIDRDLTSEEKSTVLANIMKLVDSALKTLFRRAWDSAIISLRDNSVDVVDFVSVTNSEDDSTGGNFSQSVNTLDCKELDLVGNKDYRLRVKLCCEDDLAILNTRRKFSSEIYSYVSNKFSKIMKERYILDDGTVVGTYPWRKVSKKIFPIVKDEIHAIIEKERKEISDILLRSRVDISSLDVHGTTRITRVLTSNERSEVMETVMKSVYEKVTINLSRIWNKISKLPPSLRLRDLSGEYKLELDNTRLEFIGALGGVVDEHVDSLLSGIGEVNSDFLYDVLSKKSNSFFKEGGFLGRVESLLLEAKVLDASGNCSTVTCDERKYILKEFIDMVDSDRDCLIKKRVGKLHNVSSLGGLNLLGMSSVSSVYGEYKCHDGRKKVITAYGVDSALFDHSYAKKSYYGT
ncbi:MULTISPECIES: hypothetical protein [Candidatus Ichthyocystis]|uniref:Putative coiled coil protein n=1 Tax=Candidatus Ichthyocystis hellenicum TaxID=1561003 RepID=A0A0S4M4A0_9BURK|nr:MULTISPECIES: hypothetical protein [Ichthyocystis]CUT17682.1 putative coiled coil protein [Candidatus Ichthyocystis hellenicum]